MLKVTVLAVGRDKDRWVSDGIAHFEKLLSRWCRVSWIVVSSPPGAGSKAPEEIRRDEGSLLLAKLAGASMVVALTDRGTTATTESFSALLERWQINSGGSIVFVIGGPHGLHGTVLERADLTLSLSPLTMSHQVVRLVLLEQLYRAFSILRGTDYHK